MAKRATMKAAKKKKKKQRARGTSPHPGVVLRSRTWASGQKTWFARWTDPITKKVQDTNLTKLRKTNAEGRKAWAISKSKKLGEMRAALADGRVAREGPLKVQAIVKDYLARAKVRLAPRTVASYSDSLELFKLWATEVGLRELRQLSPPMLPLIVDWLAARPRQCARRGGTRGEFLAVGGTRAPTTTNRDIRHVRAFLNDARRRGRAPKLTSDDITEGLKLLRTDRPRPQVLRPADAKKLLEAALGHDAVCFEMTRAEKAGELEPGSTARYKPIAPLTMAALLSGCRIGELLSLTWDNVHLEGDGELVVTATASKTRRERGVDLSVCPSLARLLAAMRLRAQGSGLVFGLTADEAQAAKGRLLRRFGAPKFTWQTLRSTCASYLACAPSIFGAASAYRESAQLGHSVVIAERNYVGRVKNISPDARTLEAALAIEDICEQVVRRNNDEPMQESPERSA